MSTQAPLTLTVPEAGKRYFNLSRNASYAAAERGEIPTVRIGKLLRVPIRALEAMLDSAARKSAKGRAA
jgi:excisionase family DNA binding protein